MQSLFLKFPGEIHNRIYELVADEAEPVRLSRQKFEDFRPKDCLGQTDLSDDPKPDNPKPDNDSRSERQRFDSYCRPTGNYAALTRVCRQIREEYLPIQQRNARVSVRHLDLATFMETFFDGHRICMKELVIFEYTEDEMIFNTRAGHFIWKDPLLSSVMQAESTVADRVTFEALFSCRNNDILLYDEVYTFHFHRGGGGWSQNWSCRDR